MENKHLNEKIMECISSPHKCRLLIEIMKQGEVTAKHLAEKCNDIPQTTLYRHLKRMTLDGVLKVVNEKQIRGTIERTYALAFDPSDPQPMWGQNTGEAYMQMFLQYFLTFAKQFQNYCEKPDIDIKNDKSGFSLSHIYLSDDELEEVVTSISKILYPLQNNKPMADRKMRTIGLIISPEHQEP